MSPSKRSWGAVTFLPLRSVGLPDEASSIAQPSSYSTISAWFFAADALLPNASAYLAQYNIYVIPSTPTVLTKDPITPVIHPDTRAFLVSLIVSL